MTRKLLLGLGLVAGVIIAVFAPPIALAGAVAHIAHAAWVGTNVLCAAVGFASAVQVL
jgi:hypothetical protein